MSRCVSKKVSYHLDFSPEGNIARRQANVDSMMELVRIETTRYDGIPKELEPTIDYITNEILNIAILRSNLSKTKKDTEKMK